MVKPSPRAGARVVGRVALDEESRYVCHGLKVCAILDPVDSGNSLEGRLGRLGVDSPGRSAKAPPSNRKRRADPIADASLT